MGLKKKRCMERGTPMHRVYLHDISMALAFQGLGAADNLNDFIGDGSLAGFVVAEAQFFEEFGGIVGGFLHGVHTGAGFGG